MKKINIAILAIGLFAIACSTDRTILREVKPIGQTETPPTPVEEPETPPTPEEEPETPPEEPKEEFLSIDKATLAKLGSQTEKKTIKSDSDLPFTGSQGTEVWIYPRNLRMPDGSAVTYPIEIEMLELFTPKDMILHQMPTVSRGRLLTTAGEMNIRAYKDGKELTLDRYNSTQIVVPAKGELDNDMWLFYGEPTDLEGNEFIDWYVADSSKREDGGRLFPRKEDYVIFPSRIGWINCDRFYNFKEAKTVVTFSSENPPVENILIYLYFPDIKSLMQVYKDTSGEVPVGQTVKVVAVGITKNEEYRTFYQEIVVQDKQKVEIKLTPTTKEAFLQHLDTL